MGSHVAAPVLTPNIKYDSARDFVPIGPTAHSPAVIVARKDFPAKDLKEFVELLKSGSATLKQGRGSNLAMNDMIGGHIDYICEQSVSVAEQVKSGTIKAYGVAAAERLASLPE